jgi:hypothetical protein
VSEAIRLGLQVTQDLQTGSRSSSVVFTPVGADVVPSSVFAGLKSVLASQRQSARHIHPTIMAALIYSPAGRARWIDVRMKSSSTDCPVERPTFDPKVSRGSALIHSSFPAAEELVDELQVVFVMSESNVDWKTVVLGAVRGNAPPLWRIAPRNSLSSLPP